MALITVSIANHRETRRKLIKVKLNKMKVQLDELEELLTETDHLLESRAIPRILNQQIMDHINAMLQLDPQAHYLDAVLENAEKRAVILADERDDKRVNRIRTSDAKIAKAKRSLEEAGKILQVKHAKGALSKTELDTFTQELAWTYLTIDVVSLISEGHKALKSNPAKAHAYYNSAKSVLVKSKNLDPRKNQFIRQVTDMMLKRRTAISEDLMPETEYNPAPANDNPG